ncbi:MAG: nitrogenase-stabilizing/protective protein NifW [Betaproteobacteria bacterium]|nr:nitrogenase-stabilizing/protective protein NifW [Betaproteobacteria bacterium]
MNPAITALNRLSSAEEIFAHFDLPFEPAVLNVNRLHILKRFNQYLGQSEGMEGIEYIAAHTAARELLERAYRDFLGSSARQQKVFKVLQSRAGAPGQTAPIRWHSSG